MSYGYYGSQYSNSGLLDQVYAWGKEWINSAPMNINRQAMHTWLDGKGASQLTGKLMATLGQNPNQNQALNFVVSEMNHAAMQLGLIAQTPQQFMGRQPMQHQGISMVNTAMARGTHDSYAGVVPHQPEPQIQQPKEPIQAPEVKEVKQVNSFQPREINSEPYNAPGLTGNLTFYERGEDRFCHLKCTTDIALANREELISYLKDNKPAGKCIVQVESIEYMRFNIPSAQFQSVINGLKGLMVSPGIRNMVDYELINAFNHCLRDIPKGMTDKLEEVIVLLANRYITNRALQELSNLGTFFHIGEFSDIKDLLSNTSGAAKLKSAAGYKSRMKAMLFEILRKLSEAVLDTGMEFGAESPWLGLCGNLKLPNENKLVKEVYLSPDRDAISVQKTLAEKYTILSIPKTTFVAFVHLNEDSTSVFNKLTVRRRCSIIQVPKDEIEYIVGKESSGIEPVEVIVMDPIYPTPQIFMHGVTLDQVAVVVRW